MTGKKPRRSKAGGSRTRAAAAPEERELEYRRIFETANEGFWMMDREHRTTYVNRHMADMLGCRPDDVVGKPLESFMFEEDLPTHRERMALRRRESGAGYECRLRRADDGTLWTIVSATALKDAQGDFAGSFLILTDITGRKLAEDSHAASERKLRTILDTLSEGVALNEIVSDEHGEMIDYRILEVNAAFSTVADYEPGPVIGNLATKLYGMSPEVIRGFWKSHRESTRTAHTEMASPRNGRTYSISTSPFDDGRFVTTFEDITERKRLEAEREQFHRFFETSADIMVIADPNGTFLKTNPSCTEILGYSEAELVARPFLEFVIPEDQQSTADEMARQMQKGCSLNFENRYVCKNGSVKWLSWRATYDKAEGVTYATACDITQLKQATQELERVFALSSDMICVADIEGRFKKVNPAFGVTLGYTDAELLSRPFLEFVHPDDVAKTLAVAREKLALGVTVFGFENRYRRKDGSYRWLSWTSNPLPEIGVTYAIARDVTGRKAAEDRLHYTLQEKEVLLKELHHRVKNNLQVIQSLLNLQAQEVDDSVSRQRLEEGRDRVTSIALVHEQLYSSESLSHLDFASYLKRLVQEIAATHRRQDVEIVVEAGEVSLGLQAAIPCGLIVHELVSNSLKHAFPAGSGGRIRVGLAAGGAGEWLLTVEDDGVGFPAGVGLENTPTLGLRLVAALVGQLHGTAAISRQGGSRVSIVFPETGGERGTGNGA